MKTKIKKVISTLFAGILVISVFLTATHAKDLVNPTASTKAKARVIETQAARAQDDPMQKSLGDLHNHTDKTMLKHFVKQVGGDSPSLAARREDNDEHTTDEQSFSMRLFEAFFMMQLAFAYARS